MGGGKLQKLKSKNRRREREKRANHVKDDIMKNVGYGILLCA